MMNVLSIAGIGNGFSFPLLNGHTTVRRAIRLWRSVAQYGSDG